MCYGCLLISEPKLSKEMQQLCLLRQVAWVASMEGYPLKESDLAKHIGELQQRGSILLKYLPLFRFHRERHYSRESKTGSGEVLAQNQQTSEQETQRLPQAVSDTIFSVHGGGKGAAL